MATIQTLQRRLQREVPARAAATIGSGTMIYIDAIDATIEMFARIAGKRTTIEKAYAGEGIVLPGWADTISRMLEISYAEPGYINADTCLPSGTIGRRYLPSSHYRIRMDVSGAAQLEFVMSIPYLTLMISYTIPYTRTGNLGEEDGAIDIDDQHLAPFTYMAAETLYRWIANEFSQRISPKTNAESPDGNAVLQRENMKQAANYRARAYRELGVSAKEIEQSETIIMKQTLRQSNRDDYRD